MAKEKVMKVGVIKGIDLLMKRKDKAHKGDLMVSRGTGTHVEKKHKEKTKQKEKQNLRRYY